MDAGEAFVDSFAGMTRSMVSQSRTLARKVSLAQLLDGSTGIADNAVKENVGNINNSSSNYKGSGGGGSGSRASAVHKRAIEDLRSVDAIVLDLERAAAELRDAIERRRRGNDAIQQMSESTRQLNAQLAAACAALPEHLPHAAPPAVVAPPVAPPRVTDVKAVVSGVGAAGENAAVVGAKSAARVAASSAATVPVLDLVTVGELEGVPRSTRARLTIAQVNAAVTEIQKSMERRHAFLSKPRNKMSEKQRRRFEELQRQEVPAHGGEPFIAEADLRALPAFKKGEVTAKALIATLRNLNRLKGVRAAGMMTYIVQGGY